MRRSLILAFILFTGLFSAAQQSTRIYEIRSNIPVWPCGILGERVDASQFCDPPYGYCIPPFKSRFAVVRAVDSGKVVIRFLEWSKSRYVNTYYRFNKVKVQNNVRTSNNNIGDSVEVQRYFLINQADLDSNCVPVYAKSGSFTVGLVTMPLKLRLGHNFDFQGSFSLGSTAGYKKRISEFNDNYVNFLFGASISTVNLDSFSTGGRVSGQPLNNIATFSPSLGIVFEFGRAQAGVFYGWDMLSRSMQSQYQWIHNKRPWISVGFGFTIFNVNSQGGQGGAPTQNGGSAQN